MELITAEIIIEGEGLGVATAFKSGDFSGLDIAVKLTVAMLSSNARGAHNSPYQLPQIKNGDHSLALRRLKGFERQTLLTPDEYTYCEDVLLRFSEYTRASGAAQKK